MTHIWVSAKVILGQFQDRGKAKPEIASAQLELGVGGCLQTSRKQRVLRSKFAALASDFMQHAM